MVCQKCGVEIDDGSNLCTECGALQPESSAQQPTPSPPTQPPQPHKKIVAMAKGEKQKWFDNPTTIILFLLFCFPIGLFFLWKGKSLNLPWKIILTAALAVMIIVGTIMSVVTPNISSDNTKGENTSENSSDISSGDFVGKNFSLLTVAPSQDKYWQLKNSSPDNLKIYDDKWLYLPDYAYIYDKYEDGGFKISINFPPCYDADADSFKSHPENIYGYNLSDMGLERDSLDTCAGQPTANIGNNTKIEMDEDEANKIQKILDVSPTAITAFVVFKLSGDNDQDSGIGVKDIHLVLVNNGKIIFDKTY
jgi:hypothetical protein